LAESLFPGKGAALSAAWRTKQLEYTWLRSLMGKYEDFSRVTAAALEWSLESLGLEPAMPIAARLLDEYRRLAMYPEVPRPSRRWPHGARSRSCPTAIPRCSRPVVDHNGLRDRFRGGVLSVHPTGLQAVAQGLRAGGRQARAAAHHDGLRVVERLGRGRRQDLRLSAPSG
jgi:2-haloacid dehalogenase